MMCGYGNYERARGAVRGSGEEREEMWCGMG